MRKVFQIIDSVVQKISTMCLWLSAIAIFLMAFLCFCDVFMRYFFGNPITGGQEMVQCFMAIFVFCGMGMASRQYRLTRVPLFLDKMSSSTRSFVQSFGSILCCAASALFCSQLFQSTIRYFHKASVRIPTIEIPYWPFYGIAAIGCGIMALEMLLRFFREIDAGITAAKKQNDSDQEVAN